MYFKDQYECPANCFTARHNDNQRFLKRIANVSLQHNIIRVVENNCAVKQRKIRNKCL